MNRENMKNIIILKNLPSNLIDEAIMVIKDKNKNLNYDEFITTQEETNNIVQGYMNEEDLKKIEKIKKENRKYIIKEAEIVVSNYISKMDNHIKENRTKKIELRYKKIKLLNFFLGLTTILSIIFSIIL